MTAHWPTIPAEVIAGITLRWPDRAAEWAATVEAELPELCARYNATPRTVLPARYGFVIAADTPAGGLVLRSSPDPDGPTQAQVATALADLGIAPSIHEITTGNVNTSTVMDEVRPGTPLATTDVASINLDAVAAPFAAMRDQPPPATDMPNLFDWMRDRLHNDHLTDLRRSTETAPAHVRRDALKILDDLAQDTQPALCHGDASTWNILSSKPGRWLLIDPRGISGEVAYDLAVLSFKTARGQPSGEMLARLAEVSGVNLGRVHAWITIVDAARV